MNLTEIVEECKTIPLIYRGIKEGYSFGKYVVSDTKKRMNLLGKENPPPLNGIKLLLQLAEYELILEGVSQKDLSPYESGFVLYLLIHPNERKFMDESLKFITAKKITPEKH